MRKKNSERIYGLLFICGKYSDTANILENNRLGIVCPSGDAFHQDVPDKISQ